MFCYWSLSSQCSEYASRVELLCAWHGSLLQHCAVYMTTRGVNKQRQIQECTPHVHVPPSLSVLESPLSLLCLDKQSQGKPCRTLQHLSSEVRLGQDGHFAVNNALSAHENRLYAWESDMLCSLYTPLTNLSIVKMGGWRSIKARQHNPTGAQGETGSFIIDIWNQLQKYWLRKAWLTK